MLFRVGVSCRILYSIVIYLYVSCSGSFTSVGEERAIFTCNYVVSIRRGFLFIVGLGMGCVILLWHSLGIQYNYFHIYNGKSVESEKQIFTSQSGPSFTKLFYNMSYLML